MINKLHAPFLKPVQSDPYHTLWREFVEIVNNVAEPRILELGSRNIAGTLHKSSFIGYREYIGFDILTGENVDIVGDIHELSQFFPKNQFDIIFAMSVFEHLLMPWKAVLEINQVLKIDGYICIATHPTWPAHELPWDFWRYQQNCFKALFNEYTGFEIVSLAEGVPCKIYSLASDAPTREIFYEKAHLGVIVIARKIANYCNEKLKWNIKTSDITQSMYPSKH